MVRFEITLDKRTQKKNGKYPLKLRVTDYNKVRFVSLNVDYTEKEYDSIFFHIEFGVFYRSGNRYDRIIAVERNTLVVGSGKMKYSFFI